MSTYRVSAAVSADKCSKDLINNARAIGAQLIITPYLIRAVYEGPSRQKWQEVIDLFEKEEWSDIQAYGKLPSPKKKRRKKR